MDQKTLPCNIESDFEERIATIAYGKVIGQLNNIDACRKQSLKQHVIEHEWIDKNRVVHLPACQHFLERQHCLHVEHLLLDRIPKQPQDFWRYHSQRVPRSLERMHVQRTNIHNKQHHVHEYQSSAIHASDQILKPRHINKV